MNTIKENTLELYLPDLSKPGIIMRSVILLFLLLSYSRYLSSQGLKQVLPPSPNAASLGKFADFPANLYNGVPQIDIPIWTIDVSGLKVPVSLSYHAGGIQVAEVPSWVGLGWSLSAGGVITRSVHGTPDDATGGFLVNTYIPLPECSNAIGNAEAVYNYYEAATRGANDTEPDMFYFNFCGISGKFVFDRDGNVHTIPYQKIKIRKNPTNPSATALADWEIITEDGTIYYFAVTEYMQNVTNSFGNDAGASATSYIGSWYLKEIRSPRTNAKISFEYATGNCQYSMPSSQTTYEYLYPDGAIPCVQHGSYSTNWVNLEDAKSVSKITFPNGSVEFTKGKYRHDMQGGQVLDKITIRNSARIVKSFNLQYNYFGGNGMIEFSGLTEANANTSANTSLRLSLKGIQEIVSGNMSGQSYEFTYENSVWLPDRVTSKAVDNWGYFNGELDNTTLIPSYINHSGTLVIGANRQTYEPFARAGVLKKIKYPTGGYTTFEFESNETDNPLYPDDIVEITARSGAGLCYYNPSNVFQLNNASNQTTMKLKFFGSKWPVVATTGCSTPIYNPSQPWTYIYFNVYEVSDPANPVNMNVLNNIVGPITIGYASADYTNDIVLPNGKYQVQARVGGPDGPEVSAFSGVNVDAMYTFTLDGVAIVENTNKKAGGLRIEEMASYDPLTNKSSVKTYDYTVNNTQSTGKINYIPVYEYDYSEIQACSPAANTEVKYKVRTSSSLAPLTNMQGGNVGYDKVTVFYGKDDNGDVGLNGKSEYFYDTKSDFFYLPSVITGGVTSNICYNPGRSGQLAFYPFAGAISLDWARGALRQEINYRNTNGAFYKVDETINTYKDDFLGIADTYNASYDVLAAKVNYARRVSQPSPQAPRPILSVQYYFIPSKYAKLIRQKKYIYTSSGEMAQEITHDYTYNNAGSDLQLKTDMLNDSKGNAFRIEYKYTGDYTANAVYAAMKDRNILNTVISSDTYKNSILIKSVKNNYNQFGTFYLPESTDVQIINKLPASKYSFLSYDNNGNLLEQKMNEDMVTSYIYDYSLALPVAEIKNARIGNAAYTSFESNGKGNWNFSGIATADITAPTGTKCYNLAQSGGAISKANLPAGQPYTISYWSKNGAYTISGATGSVVTGRSYNGWTYYEHRVNINTGAISLTGSGYIDELRLYPSESAMITYTYDPGVGLTCQCDSKNQITYYEYDSLGRLKLIKDQNGKILKQYDYQYQQSATN